MPTNGDSGASVFAKYIDKPEREPEPPLPLPTPPEALRLLNWLQNNWGKSTICARDLYRRGSGCAGDRESIRKLTELMERRGWLVPLKSHRYDRKRWQVTIGPVDNPTRNPRPDLTEDSHRTRYSIRNGTHPKLNFPR